MVRGGLGKRMYPTINRSRRFSFVMKINAINLVLIILINVNEILLIDIKNFSNFYVFFSFLLIDDFAWSIFVGITS